MELFSCIFLVTFETIVTMVVCAREICLNYFNPAPKFDNKIEKSINNIEFVKFRSVQKFSHN